MGVRSRSPRRWASSRVAWCSSRRAISAVIARDAFNWRPILRATAWSGLLAKSSRSDVVFCRKRTMRSVHMLLGKSGGRRIAPDPRALVRDGYVITGSQHRNQQQSR